jgi:hypothetical protein
MLWSVNKMTELVIIFVILLTNAFVINSKNMPFGDFIVPFGQNSGHPGLKITINIMHAPFLHL